MAKESKLSTLALRIEVLEAYRDTIIKGQPPTPGYPKFMIKTDISLVPHCENAGPFAGNNEFDLSDCHNELIESLVKIMNNKIGDLKRDMNDLMFPPRQQANQG